MSGIPGGYRLVSTYDLPDCKTILKFEILKFSDGGGVFWVTWNLDLGKKTKVFNFRGGILRHLGFGLYDNFHFGGYSGTPRIWTLWQFSLGGVFWDTSDLDSMTIFIRGYSGTPWIWTLWQFSLGGYSGTPQIWTLWQFSFWGVFWDTSDLDSMTIFIRGVFWDTLNLDSMTIFIGGVFWDTSDLDSMTIFILGSILGHLGFGLYDNFHLGGYSVTPWIWTLWQFSFWGEGEGEGEGQGEGEGEGEGEGRGRGGGGEGDILQNRGILWDLDQNFNHSSRLMHTYYVRGD